MKLAKITKITKIINKDVHYHHLTMKYVKLYGLLIPLLTVSILISIGVGAVKIPPLEVISHFLDLIGLPPLTEISESNRAVMIAIRLPRVTLALLIGAGLAVSGVAMQGLFRNPLADPGLLGISSGASLMVAAFVVMGFNQFGMYSLSIGAFLGSIGAMALIYSLGRRDKKTNITTMLLAGIAINALCGAGTGLFTYLSTDEELRTITFWQLGSLGGANWTTIQVAGPLIIFCILGMPFLANALNAFLLGENEARNLGIPIEFTKWIIVALVSLAVGASVAVAGMIGFVGLVVPHLLRLWLGPNHRVLLPGAALLGANMLVLSDLISRTLVAPAELPIGIITSLVGAPFFLYLLLKSRGQIKL